MKRNEQNQTPLRQTTLDEFTDGDILAGSHGVTVKKEPHQPRLFDPKPTQLIFQMEDKSGRSPRAVRPSSTA